MLHGLFGMGSNLGALARALADNYRVHSLDLPNHGRSDWLDEAGIGALASAVADWMDSRSVSRAALVGHSLGGKVAMQLALSQPARVDALVVADIAPVLYQPRHEAVFAALDAVAAGGCRSRAEAGQRMAAHIREEQVIQFLLLSLQRGEDGSYNWRFNLEGLRENYSVVLQGLATELPYEGRVLFIKGSESDYILPEHQDVILGMFPRAQVRIMADCGHWLHAEQPRLFNAIVHRFLDD
ncbi:MAG: alpha/beta fold hydrolase [Halieaceae bacterium]